MDTGLSPSTKRFLGRKGRLTVEARLGEACSADDLEERDDSLDTQPAPVPASAPVAPSCPPEAIAEPTPPPASVAPPTLPTAPTQAEEEQPARRRGR